jgi:hypothetical protein
VATTTRPGRGGVPQWGAMILGGVASRLTVSAGAFGDWVKINYSAALSLTRNWRNLDHIKNIDAPAFRKSRERVFLLLNGLRKSLAQTHFSFC